MCKEVDSLYTENPLEMLRKYQDIKNLLEEYKDDILSLDKTALFKLCEGKKEILPAYLYYLTVNAIVDLHNNRSEI
ncbi:MAG: hypothetical protein ABFD25_22670 [Clostridiaceae bacterium]